MKMQIPSDWNGQDWQCLQVQWPNSPQFAAILTGLLSLLTRGYVWQETGDLSEIPAVQQIAWQIWDKNYPFVDCDGEIIAPQDGLFFVGSDDSEDCEDSEMGCGGIPRDVLRWSEDGKLQYQNCGVWYDVLGNMPTTDTTVLPDIGDIVDKPAGLVDATACSMATALVGAMSAMVLASFENAEIEDLLAFKDGLENAVPGTDFAFSVVPGVWIEAGLIKFAGYSSEASATGIAQALKCQFVTIIPDGNTGISEATYNSLVNMTELIVRNAFWRDGDLVRNAIAGDVGSLWAGVLNGLGAKDAQKVTYYAQPNVSDDCDCPPVPGSENYETIPDTNGWYWSEAYTMPWFAPTGEPGYDVPFALALLHDAYGIAYIRDIPDYWDGATGVAQEKPKNEAVVGIPHDKFLWWTNSENWQTLFGQWIVSADPDIRVAVTAMLAPSTAIGGDHPAQTSAVIAAPTATRGQIIHAPIHIVCYTAAQGSSRFRVLHNINSASHQ